MAGTWQPVHPTSAKRSSPRSVSGVGVSRSGAARSMGDAARTRATAEHEQRSELDKAFAAFTAAAAARVAAFAAYAEAEDKEEAALAEVYRALAPLEAGGSGAVKAEA